MDTEQIQQQMKTRRALIDHKLDLLATRSRQTRRSLRLPASALVVAAITLILWRSRQRRAMRSHMRLVA